MGLGSVGMFVMCALTVYVDLRYQVQTYFCRHFIESLFIYIHLRAEFLVPGAKMSTCCQYISPPILRLCRYLKYFLLEDQNMQNNEDPCCNSLLHRVAMSLNRIHMIHFWLWCMMCLQLYLVIQVNALMDGSDTKWWKMYIFKVQNWWSWFLSFT